VSDELGGMLEEAMKACFEVTCPNFPEETKDFRESLSVDYHRAAI
jgi:hypothetical protein